MSRISPIIVVVGQGRVLDYIDGITQRRDTPEEYVRQEISKSLVREYGYAKADIEVEFGLRIGSSKPRADLVIFPSGEDHVQGNASIVVECKASTVKANDRKDGILQLQSYMGVCPNAQYGLWTNALERHCFRRMERNGKVEFESVPDIPAFGKTAEEAERPTFDQLKPATSDALLFAFRRCHNYIAGNQGLQKPQAFWELLKLIFCKIADERGDDIQFYAAAEERHGINGPLKVKERIGRLFAGVKERYGTIFRASDDIELDPRVLAYLVSQIQMYSLLESDVDVKGRAYEEIVGSNLRGDRGEFFTPRNVCAMAVAMLQPGEKELVLDPACGTGGFLIAAMSSVVERIRVAEESKNRTNLERVELAVRDRAVDYAQKFIVGIDFNPELVKAAKMNMVMNNDGSGALFQANSLEVEARWSDELRAMKLRGHVDILVTNPPFGSKIPIDEPSILRQYDLGHIWSYDEEADRWAMTEDLQKRQPPEILFIERCVQFLKPGTGRAALVLPDGILGSPGLGYVRQWLLRHTKVLASIDLHADTFQPGVSVQTSLVVIQRKTDELIKIEDAAGQLQDYEIFMAMADRIGHDKRGTRTYKRLPDGAEEVIATTRRFKEYVEGKPVYTTQETLEKIVDDVTPAIAQAFREWLNERD
ncbi:N-6 DNA methylase [Aurantimonas sp. DM33-3]|uniref:N-6 DNA methylase n=1 Tax=Aurantimonas sp. DM33-3 TaxID=2766955 RepID=UPI00165274A5|nr:N-6 DNA methylase [Aurantimonas sp. DM33-3]MBC6716950.1 N-6 DNA methylase [Aurantimonas sp. DM33-3]